MPTIGDVARRAGVSRTAVSFAFNKPDQLAAETMRPTRVASGSSRTMNLPMRKRARAMVSAGNSARRSKRSEMWESE